MVSSGGGATSGGRSLLRPRSRSRFAQSDEASVDLHFLDNDGRLSAPHDDLVAWSG